jgi:signal transduction histidine kinase/tetratricopeptide (TPR) repeat protein
MPPFRCFTLLCFSLCISSTGLSQLSTIDSLEQVLLTSKNEAKVDVLNQLTYEFITVDNEKVQQYNGQAIELSKKIAYRKGEAVAYTYKGVNEYLSGFLAPAHVHLHKGLRLSERIGDRKNTGYSFLQLGNLSLEEVATDSALHFFNKALAYFEDGSDPATLSKIYRNMSAAYGQQHQIDQQQKYLDSAIAIRRALPRKALLIEALLLKANNSIRNNNVNGADSILSDAEKVASSAYEYEESRFDILHIKGLILFKKGDVDGAMVLMDSASSYFLEKSLIRKYITLQMDVSLEFAHRAEYELALDHLYPALELCKLRGYNAEVRSIITTMGWIHYRLGDFPQAVVLADEVIALQANTQLKAEIGTSFLLKGATLTELRRFDEAQTNLDSAFYVFQAVDAKTGSSDALMYLGYLRVKQQMYEEALLYYGRSLELAEEARSDYSLAQVNWGLADAYFKLKKFKESTHFLDKAEYYCGLTEANEILIMCFNTRRDLLAAQGQFEASLAYSMKASQLKDSLHKSDISRKFANLEKMHQIDQRDRDIRALQQEKQLADNQIALQKSKLDQQFLLLIVGLAGLALLSFVAIAYYRFYRRIKALHFTIVEKNQRIQMQSEELAANNERISELNRGLERLVEEKTNELVKTNQELVKYNNELVQFSYTVSHHIRGPVARLLGLSDLASREQNDTSSKQLIGLMGTTAEDLDQIIKDLGQLLDLRTTPSHYREHVNLEKEWQESIRSLKESLTGSETIESDFSTLPEIFTVQSMIQSIFHNLLSNAIKYQSWDRSLVVKAKSWEVDASAVIQITDNGLGFDAELYKKQLFKLYKRFHTHVAGRGIGLYLVKAQLDILHGSIEVESAPDEGTSVTITIPLESKKQVLANKLLDTSEN